MSVRFLGGIWKVSGSILANMSAEFEAAAELGPAQSQLVFIYFLKRFNTGYRICRPFIQFLYPEIIKMVGRSFMDHR